VAQVARTVGRSLQLNEDLVEAVALAHDLGHSPFGHIGETALDACMADWGGFEHNRQSLRVVDELGHPYPGFNGLNLTHPTRECIARHETRYDNPDSNDFPPGLRAPLEGQLVDLSDEIAFTSADLEDALSNDRLAEERLASMDLWKEAMARANRYWPGARPIHLRIQATRCVLAILCEDLIAQTRANLAAALPTCVQDVQQATGRMVEFSPTIEAAKTQLQDLLLHEVYLSDALKQRNEKITHVITALFDRLVSDPQQLPPRYAQRVGPLTAQRVTCDYIAGMTDQYCTKAYQTTTPAR
jgi:dGTPase